MAAHSQNPGTSATRIKRGPIAHTKGEAAETAHSQDPGTSAAGIKRDPVGHAK